MQPRKSAKRGIESEEDLTLSKKPLEAKCQNRRQKNRSPKVKSCQSKIPKQFNPKDKNEGLVQAD
jgi:hypothetical protein